MLALFANVSSLDGLGDVERACREADIVVSLGGVDLGQLASVVPASKPALCVLGPRDEHGVPPPFRQLHANGFTFRGWRIAGLSGAPLRALRAGHYVTESEASALLGDLPACDILLTRTPPAGIAEIELSGIPSGQDLVSITEYLDAKAPTYHFYAHPYDVYACEYHATLSVGVHGSFQTPPLRYV